MSLSSALRKALAPSLLALMTAFAPAANAADAASATGKSLKLGDCAEASAVKEALTRAGYKNYFVYDVKLLDEKSPNPVWVRESMWGKDDLKSGFYLSRGGNKDQDLCVNALLSDIIIANPEDQSKVGRVDTRFFSKESLANDDKVGINGALVNLQRGATEYPVIQAKIQQADGGLSYMTIVQNPRTHQGTEIFSSLSGKFIDARTQLVAGPESARIGLTPAAKELLARQKSGTPSVVGVPPVAAL